MNPSPEAAVRPRRNLLNALGVAALGLWGSVHALALPTKEKKSRYGEDEPELFLVVGRLCLDKDFRTQFFKQKVDPDEAINKTSMVSQYEVRQILRAILKNKRAGGAAPSSKDADRAPSKHSGGSMTTTDETSTDVNPMEAACGNVGTAFDKLVDPGLRMPCKPWPCG